MLLTGVFGARVAAIYVLLGLAIAVAGGTLIGALHMEKHVEGFILASGSVDIETPGLTRRERLKYAREQAAGIILVGCLFNAFETLII